jgi:MoaA/NifB/PqqE/SkfB family radical SAM enzyme
MIRDMEITIEVTSNCQAKCPGCIRHKVFNPNTDLVSSPPKNWNLPLEVHNKLIDDLAEKSKVKFLTYDGSFGDSPFHPDFLEMIEYSASKLKGDVEPFGDEKIGQLSPEFNGLHDMTISTNGSYKTPAFWKRLGEILDEHLPNRHHVMFDLDGVDNKTQNMYRIATDFDKIIENAEAFISGGGQAVWKMIPFDFNEELEEKAKMLAAKHGFQKFQRNRIQRVEQKAVQIALSEKLNELDKMKEEDEDLMNISEELVNENLKKGKEIIKDIPIDTKLDAHQNLEKIRETAGITCIWGAANRYQISHDGSVWRCCWMNSNYQYKTEYDAGERENYLRFIKKYNEGWNNLHSHSFHDIISHDFFIKDLEDSFSNEYDDENNPKLKVCTTRCSNFNTKLTKKGIY